INADNGRAAAVKFLPKATFPSGTFSADRSGPTAKLEKGAEYEVIECVAHGNNTDDTLLDTGPVAVTDAHRDALFPAPTSVLETTATVSGASEADGLTVKVEGSGYTDLPAASTGKAGVGVYVALRDKSISNEQINDDTDLAAAVNFLYG